MKLSAVVLTRNEEKNIVDCLESLDFCDEVLVIDDNSTDHTLDAINNLKSKKITVVKRNLDDNFSSQRNYGLEKAKGEWVLFIDADERVTPSLKKEIEKAIHQNNVNGYYLKRSDIIWGKKLLFGETNIYLLRLAKKNSGKWKGNVHEFWDIAGPTEKLSGEILHYPHHTVREFLEEINRYTTLRAKELYEKKTKVSGFDIIFYPKAKFIYNYFFKQGFRDGTHGFVFACLMSFHSFLVRGKLWLMTHRKIS